MIHRKALVVLVVGCMALMGAEECAPPENPGATSRYEKLAINGADIKNGYFDISVEYGPDGVGWLAYSRVELPKYVGTHIAKSTDKGRTWNHVTTVNESVDGTLNHKGKELKGAWRSETATLLYDRKDQPKQRWKLFSQRYFTKANFKPKDRMFEHAWVEYRTAATPAGPWSEPIRLFGKENCKVDLSKVNKELASMSHFNEIGSVEVNGVIYLSMDASTTHTGMGEWERRKIVLVSSANHGKTWKYVGTLTDYEDSKAFGYRVFTGSALAREGNKVYALLTPSGAWKGNQNHHGTYVVEFADISRAKLKRDKTGKLLPVKKLDTDLHSGGLADYDEGNVNGGILISQINMKARPDVFQIYKTGERLAGP